MENLKAIILFFMSFSEMYQIVFFGIFGQIFILASSLRQDNTTNYKKCATIVMVEVFGLRLA
jgi:hypothetical protein